MAQQVERLGSHAWEQGSERQRGGLAGEGDLHRTWAGEGLVQNLEPRRGFIRKACFPRAIRRQQ